MHIRKPVVAGRFYPSNKNELKKTIKNIFLKEKKKIDYSLSENNILGGVSPHAGYMYSAYQAIHLFELLAKSKE